MKILFITMFKIKDINDSSIYHDLVRQFLHLGHQVTVINPNSNKIDEIVHEGNLTLARLDLGKYEKQRRFKKVISMIFFERRIITWLNNNRMANFDLIVYTTPPITYHKIITHLKKSNPKIFSYLLLKDIFPQNAIDLDLIPQTPFFKPIINYYKQIEKKMYESADMIGCMSQGNLEYINHHHNLYKKSEINANSIEIQGYDLLSPDDVIKRKKQLRIPLDKVIYIYGGNIGVPQGPKYIMDFIKKFESIEHSFLIIIGSGTHYNKIESYIRNNNFNNTLILPSMPKKKYRDYVMVSDIGLVFLNRKFTIPNYPSRILDYLEFSLPVLAATDLTTDIKSLIIENQIGDWVLSKNAGDLIEKVRKWSLDRKLRLQAGQNARILLEKEFDVKLTSQKILRHVKSEENDV